MNPMPDHFLLEEPFTLTDLTLNMVKFLFKFLFKWEKSSSVAVGLLC